MKFKDKFKPGDVICSDNFLYGKCMVVIGLAYGEGGYSCEDLVIDNQRWRAREHSNVSLRSYDWRIATDDDIINYLDRFVTIDLGIVGSYNVTLTDTGVMLDDAGESRIHLEAEDLVELRGIVDRYVATGV